MLRNHTPENTLRTLPFVSLAQLGAQRYDIIVGWFDGGFSEHNLEYHHRNIADAMSPWEVVIDSCLYLSRIYLHKQSRFRKVSPQYLGADPESSTDATSKQPSRISAQIQVLARICRTSELRRGSAENEGG